MSPRLLLSVVLLLSPAIVPGVALGKPGPRLTVEINGIEGAMLEAVRDRLGLYRHRDSPLLNEALIHWLHRKAKEEIRLALQPFGYYRPRIEAALEREADGWRALYRIDPGEPVRLTRVDVVLLGDGAQDPELRAWQARYPLRRGDILRHQDYEEAKEALLQLARDRGYLEGRLQRHRILIDLATYTATIELHYNSGPRYAFGETVFDQEGFAEEFLQRYLPYRPGEPYDAGRLLTLQRLLADSDYFERVDVEARPEAARDGRIPVHVGLVRRKDTRYTAGIGYATDTGGRGLLGYEKRRANRYGHRYDATLRRSAIRSSVAARYHIPLQRPVSDYLTYTVAWVDEDTDTTQRTTGTIGLDVTQQAGLWLRTLGLNFERERFRLGNAADSTLLMPRVRWQRIKADQRIAPRRGWMLGLELRGASDALLSDTSFLQMRSEGKYIRGLTPRTRLLLRGTAGLSWTPEFIELPASQRFLAGGDQSIRGYAYNSLGPVDESGRVTGGRHLLVGSLEVEQALGGRTAAALFLDAGNAYNGTAFNFRRGAGIGLRWRTPLGAVRIDLARALSRPGRPWRLHLTLGPDL